MKKEKICNLINELCYEKNGELRITSHASQGGLDIAMECYIGKETIEVEVINEFHDFVSDYLIPYSVNLDATGMSLSWSFQKEALRIVSDGSEYEFEGIEMLTDYLSDKEIEILESLDYNFIFEFDSGYEGELKLMEILSNGIYEFDDVIPDHLRESIKRATSQILKDIDLELSNLYIHCESHENVFDVSCEKVITLTKDANEVLAEIIR